MAPHEQGCCGALALHAGQERQAKADAPADRDTFERAMVETIVVNAAGCGSAVSVRTHLLRDDDPDYAERAKRLRARWTSRNCSPGPEPRAPRHPLPLRVAYHDACHLQHAQGVRQQPRRLLQGIPCNSRSARSPSRRFAVDLPACSTSWNLKRRPRCGSQDAEPARRQRRFDASNATRCLMQLAVDSRTPDAHAHPAPVELLDASIEERSPSLRESPRDRSGSDRPHQLPDRRRRAPTDPREP